MPGPKQRRLFKDISNYVILQKDPLSPISQSPTPSGIEPYIKDIISDVMVCYLQMIRLIR